LIWNQSHLRPHPARPRDHQQTAGSVLPAVRRHRATRIAPPGHHGRDPAAVGARGPPGADAAGLITSDANVDSTSHRRSSIIEPCWTMDNRLPGPSRGRTGCAAFR
jgi:hypothetical protein